MSMTLLFDHLQINFSTFFFHSVLLHNFHYSILGKAAYRMKRVQSTLDVFVKRPKVVVEVDNSTNSTASDHDIALAEGETIEISQDYIKTDNLVEADKGSLYLRKCTI